MKEMVESVCLVVPGKPRRARTLAHTASHSSLAGSQSDASQEAERLTDGWAGWSADVPNLSYGQFVLFYSFIALANCRGKASVETAFFLLITVIRSEKTSREVFFFFF